MIDLDNLDYRCGNCTAQNYLIEEFEAELRAAREVVSAADALLREIEDMHGVRARLNRELDKYNRVVKNG